MPDASPVGTVGRYTLFSEIASGGMATVHFGRLAGPAGFARIVAVKRLMPNLARDPEFVAMFLDEARVAARIRHPNVVQTLDIVASDGELLLIMEYVQGESLSRLIRASLQADADIPLPVVSAIATATLHGLHAAHEATSEGGVPLGVVHRDVSPQNILVGVDGLARVLDFGIASAVGRLQVTRDGQIKGKLAYMAPEQFLGKNADRRADIYAASVVLWECLTQKRLFRADNDAAMVTSVLHGEVPPPSSVRTDVPPALDALVMRGLQRDPAARFATAREMALALEELLPPATHTQVSRWVESLAGDVLKLRSQRINDIESASRSLADLQPPASPLAPPASPPASPATPPAPAVAPVTVETTASAPLVVVPAPGMPRRTLALAVGAGMLISFAGAWVLGVSRREPEAPASSAASASVAPVQAASSAPASPAPEAPATTSATAPAAATSARAVKKVAPAVDCSQPFFTDSKGIQRVKRQCLK